VKEVKGTKVLAVHIHNLSFLTGAGGKYFPEWREYWCSSMESGGTVNCTVKSLTILGAIVACTALSFVGLGLAQDAGKKSTGGNAAALSRGKAIFQQKCAVCHYDTSDQKKIGPGLKGISKRGTFSVNGNKITDDSLRAWIENGDQLMPPFKDVLEPSQIKDVIAYVKTL
jgi:cytochrome c